MVHQEGFGSLAHGEGLLIGSPLFLHPAIAKLPFGTKAPPDDWQTHCHDCLLLGKPYPLLPCGLISIPPSLPSTLYTSPAFAVAPCLKLWRSNTIILLQNYQCYQYSSVLIIGHFTPLLGRCYCGTVLLVS